MLTYFISLQIFFYFSFNHEPSSFTFQENQSPVDDKIALLVAVSEYEKNSGWSSLNAFNDVPLVRQALIQQGFHQDNIAVLENEQATKEGIFAAIETQLIKKAKRGSTVVFHFSGHGQQVQDDNGDELDGLDESIVPYNSPLYYQEGIYEGENLIRDEELGTLMLQLRKKLGKNGQLLVLLDACHSGTGTRALQTARGTEIIMADSSTTSFIPDSGSERNSLSEELKNNKTNLAPMVSIFGSAANQLNYETRTKEGEPAGSLSYAFSLVFSETKKEDSYRVIFEKIKLQMSSLAPGQDPQAEGDLDRTVLGGKLLGKTDYFKLCDNGWLDEQLICLNGGTLAGIFPGTVVHFHLPDTREPESKTPIAIGKVIDSTPFLSTVELEAPLSENSAKESWIFMHEKDYGTLEVKLKLDLPKGDFRNKFLDILEEYPVIKTESEQPDLILEISNEGFIQLLTPSEMILHKEPIGTRPGRQANRMKDFILKYIQGHFLRHFEMKNELLDVRLELISKKEMVNTEIPHLMVGDTFQLRVTNHGKLTAYYTVLDIQPDNVINTVIPFRGDARSPREYVLKPNESYLLEKKLTIGEPTGIEILKLIATKSPLDLSPIISSRGEQVKENQHPFEELFAATYIDESRGQTSKPLRISPVLNVYTKVFEIVK